MIANSGSTVYGGILLFIVLFLIGFTDCVAGIAIELAMALSYSAYDALQSAMVSTMSNDLFANKLPLIIFEF
ncbi:7819_t:CDS:2 [Ambispora gerdemannii]|uniref:7819_t:CDS:1 n=1 Tax=Ambispora gerdemannii TaxID=144530 RepID=A0A9N9FT49_9GLOM|nr:7819_t:CDS:2 [Ambispora gerdemannii]